MTAFGDSDLLKETASCSNLLRCAYSEMGIDSYRPTVSNVALI